jgi:hypothetical protein
MLVQKKGPDGKKILVRQPYRAEDYTPHGSFYDGIREMSGYSVRELLAMHDGPFGSAYFCDQVQRDGKTYWRFCQAMEEWCVLVEDSDRPMRDVGIVPLPPEEARAVSSSYDPRRGRPIVDAA